MDIDKRLEENAGNGRKRMDSDSVEGVEQPVEVTVFSGFQECESLAGEWDAFIEEIGGEIFLTYDWCRIWWKHYGRRRKLKIMLFRSRGDLVGLLPVFQEKIGLEPFRISAVKLVGTDFSPIAIVLPIKIPFLEAVLAHFKNILNENWSWEILRLGALSGKCPDFAQVSEAVQEIFADSRVEIKEEGPQTYFQIGANWEDQVQSLPRKQRTNARRAFRDVEARKIAVESKLVAENDWEGAFDEFVAMHQKYWNGLNKPGHFKAWPGAVKYHREEADCQNRKGRLRLLRILFDNKCVDYEYIYKFGKTYYWFLNARSNELYKTGVDFKWIALRAKMEAALGEGVTTIDSMRGDYDYKVLMGGEQLPIRSITVIPAKGLKKIKISVFRLTAMAIDLAYAKVWRRRIAPKIRLRSGTFWKIWVKSHILSP
jgi:CelD/BcsL family acetyltransferase involved in cellulose biosynthesis